MRVNQRQRPYDTREEFLDFRRKLNTKYAEAQTVGHELFSKANHSRENKTLAANQQLIDRSAELRGSRLEQKYSRSISDAATKRRHVSEMLHLINLTDKSGRPSNPAVKGITLLENNGGLGFGVSKQQSKSARSLSSRSNPPKPGKEGDFRSKLSHLISKQKPSNSSLNFFAAPTSNPKAGDTPVQSSKNSKASRSGFEDLNLELRLDNRSARPLGFNRAGKKLVFPKPGEQKQPVIQMNVRQGSLPRASNPPSSSSLYGKISTTSVSNTMKLLQMNKQLFEQKKQDFRALTAH